MSAQYFLHSLSYPLFHSREDPRQTERKSSPGLHASERLLHSGLMNSKPRAKPPIWAHQAIPPADSVIASDAAPDRSCMKNQMAMNSTAGTSKKNGKKSTGTSVTMWARGKSRR